MNEFTRITITLSSDELGVLRGMAQRDLRRPRDQARILLRQALGITDQPGVPSFIEIHNRAGVEVHQDLTDAIAE